MNLRLILNDLTNPVEKERLIAVISRLADELDTLYTTTEPDGNIKARRGKIALWNDGGAYTAWMNVDGSTTWGQITLT
jgi:hypothetical protein